MNFPLDALCRCGDEYSSHVGGSCDEIYCRCLEFEPTGQFANEVAPDEVAPDDDVSLPSLARPVESADAKLSSTSAQLRQVQQALAASQADITQVERQLADAEGERMKAERERDEALAKRDQMAENGEFWMQATRAAQAERDEARARFRIARTALISVGAERDLARAELASATTELEQLRAQLATAVEHEAVRIRALLVGPMLAAIRCIPDGEIRNGCVVSDGAKVRERLRQAYRDVVNGVNRPDLPNDPENRG